MHTPRPAILAALAVLTLAACGGGGGAGGGSPSPLPPGGVNPPVAGQQIGAHVTTGEGRTIGIGPAFAGESPAIADLTDPARHTRTARGEIRSGPWRASRGGDGSASAAELLAFLQGFQAQERAEGGGDLVIINPGPARTVRIVGRATATERALVADALARLNTALPYDRRLRLGNGRAVAVADRRTIPADEIHIHFTDGKTGWPRDDDGQPYGPTTLGLGGGLIQLRTLTALGGYAFIDRTARAHRNNPEALRITLLHELLHAWGIGAHASSSYPESVLQPRNSTDIKPRLYVTLDGALLRAYRRLPAGTKVDDLTVDDFGPWETEGFHLLMANTLGGANTEDLQAGLGWRNGLATPWAYGPEPDRTVAHLGATARWDGTLLGLTRSDGRTVRGEAAITADFERANGRADFTALEAWPHRRHPGNPGTGTQWGDGDLGYTLTFWETGTRSGFDSAAAPGDDPGVVTGVLVGTAHEGAAGVLEHPDLAAAFGGVRE